MELVALTGEGPSKDSTKKEMKRVGNLYESICSIENLTRADTIARKGKMLSYGVQVHDRNREENILKLHKMLVEKTYQTSQYTTFKIYEPKERVIFRLPFFPNRIAHHAIMNVLEPLFVSVFTSDTYSCIKGRGIHLAAKRVKEALKDVRGTRYCLKMDIRKFYPSVDHAVLKQLLRRKIKDKDLLWLLDEIIDSTDGLPIGNYLSQYFANFYLTYFDHWLKEEKRVKYYFRYADDMVILSDSKEELHGLFAEIENYLSQHLHLSVKGNYQIFPVEKRGIDFVGYVLRHTHTLLRKSIKKAFARKMAKADASQIDKSYCSYYGWAKHCNSINLIKKLTNEKICRAGHKDGSTHDGQQNKHQQDHEPRNCHSGLPHRGEQVPEKQKRKVPVFAA